MLLCVFKDLVESQESKDLQDHKEDLDQVVLVDQEEKLDHRENKDLLDLTDSLGHLVCQKNLKKINFSNFQLFFARHLVTNAHK